MPDDVTVSSTCREKLSHQDRRHTSGLKEEDRGYVRALNPKPYEGPMIVVSILSSIIPEMGTAAHLKTLRRASAAQLLQGLIYSYTRVLELGFKGTSNYPFQQKVE